MLSACKSGKPGKELEESRESDSSLAMLQEELTILHEVLYLYPSPGEIIEGFFDANLEYKHGIVNSVEKKDSYLGSRSQALNLGIYITDLAYTAKFGLAGEAVDYLEAVRHLSIQVGVSTETFESFISKAQDNINNPDSILDISNEAFYQLATFLETSKKESTLAVISVGAFVESLYLVLESHEEFEDDNPVIDQICETVCPFDNLFARAKKYQSDNNVGGIIKYLNSIDETFKQLPTTMTGTTVEKEAGKLLIGGGPDIEITKENFDDMKALIQSIRSEITTI